LYHLWGIALRVITPTVCVVCSVPQSWLYVVVGAVDGKRASLTRGRFLVGNASAGGKVTASWTVIDLDALESLVSRGECPNDFLSEQILFLGSLQTTYSDHSAYDALP
jgi:hypothetical protein